MRLTLSPIGMMLRRPWYLRFHRKHFCQNCEESFTVYCSYWFSSATQSFAGGEVQAPGPVEYV
eukprot:4559904-Pleurochrysis_carterae.AAC.3